MKIKRSEEESAVPTDVNENVSEAAESSASGGDSREKQPHSPPGTRDPGGAGSGSSSH